MVFSSLSFLCGFLPLIVLFYFSIKNLKIRNIVLLIFSLVFYSWGEPKYILLMLITVLIAYISGILIEKNNKQSQKKVITVIAVIAILLSLFTFKYLNFSINIFNKIFGLNISNLKLILPIGISFYTFQILSYIIDLYKGEVKLQKNYLKLLLYVSFFPQLIAGPIVRYNTIEEEIDNRKTTLEDFIYGLKRFIIGLSKKVIIANNVAILCDNIYSNYNGYGSNILWLAAVAYTIQIYFDFSGYSDMAIGLGRIFGFHFLENFNYPYISTSVTDFWRRWHISLSSFFRDYVYIPLGGNKKGIKKQIRNILIVWMLTGLWHGANYNFIIWGLYYGILLILEKFVLKKIIDKTPKIIRHVVVLVIITVGWVIFRIENITDLSKIIFGMFNFTHTSLKSFISSDITQINSLIYLAIGIIFSMPIYKKLFKDTENSIVLTIIEDFSLGVLFILCIMFLVSNQYNPFIYFRF